MDADTLAAKARSGAQPPQLSDPLRVLWLDAAGDWDGAHNIAQDMPDPDGARLHAYLHRKEGDLGNAAYWYRRVDEALPELSLDAEWRTLVARFSS